MMAATQRVVVIVTEGASNKLLREFIDEGYLPGFRKLLQEGAWGELVSHVVPYEPPGLMTAFTGARSSDHGCIPTGAFTSPIINRVS
jgi:predicted AlkP superfamily phosphohydrolase/phosphomutase